MPLRTLRRTCFAAGVALSLGLVACESPAEHRRAIEIIDGRWTAELPEGSLAEMTEHIRSLGKLSPGHPSALSALPLLTRQAYESESAWVRAEALRAAWSLAKNIPAEELKVDDVPAAEFNEWMRRFEELDEDPLLNQGQEIQELAQRIASFRFSTQQMSYAIDLAGVTTVRGFERQEGPVQAVFAEQAPAACRHALALITLRAGDDSSPFVREESLRATRHLPRRVALTRLASSLNSETETAVLLALLDSMEALAPQLGLEPLQELLDYAVRSSHAAVRRRATSLLEQMKP